MSVINGYATLADYKGTKAITSTSATDDAVIEQLIESASRYIDDETVRTFYPRVETRYFGVPEGRELRVDDDLLAVISVTNGDGDTLASTEYNLIPRNISPSYALKIKESSTEYWEDDDDGNTEQVIQVAAYWGFHNQYTQRAWTTGSTLGEALTAADLTWSVAATTNFAAGQIVKCGSELCIIASVGEGTITLMQRGDNGSTAATHDNGTTVYIWRIIHDIRLACLDIVKSAYSRRFGQNTTGVATITAMGVVITPEDVPSMAWQIIRKYAKRI